MAGKGGLANQLLGKRIVPKPEYGSPENKDEGPNYNIWAGMKKNLSGQFLAEVQAAYVVEGTVKVLASDPFGNTKEFYMTNVNLDTMPEGRNPR